MANAEQIEKLHALIGEIKIAMLVTHQAQSGLRARPLATLQDGSNNLYFFTRSDAGKVDEIAQDSEVCLTYAHPGDQSFVSVTGRASLVRDRDDIERFWHPIHAAWFPAGKDDPQLALLKVAIESAEYWSAPSSSVVQLFGIAKALVQGEVCAPGEHQKIDA